LRAEDIQLLNDADGVAALFSRLGYDTNARTVQSPGNLGITADTIVRRIKKIELIADNEGFFQVYLFQLVSVTVADARALATIFRNRAGNFLLVLTADFDRLDFVFVERIPSMDKLRPSARRNPRSVRELSALSVGNPSVSSFASCADSLGPRPIPSRSTKNSSPLTALLTGPKTTSTTAHSSRITFSKSGCPTLQWIFPNGQRIQNRPTSACTTYTQRLSPGSRAKQKSP
jgi:hypothetical protein